VQRIEAMKQNQSRRVVKVTKLSTLLDKHRLYDIDYCSIDTEGAELAILSISMPRACALACSQSRITGTTIAFPR
jgi:FkbM family methyltransferase